MAAGDVSAGTLLAECYLFGKGVTKNETKAVALLQDAAAAKDPRAMDQLATCYHKGIGITRDDREAFRLYSAAAKLNYLDSVGNLGVLYLTSDRNGSREKSKPRARKRRVDLFRDGAKTEQRLLHVSLCALLRSSAPGLKPIPPRRAIGIGGRRRRAIDRPRIGAGSTM